MKPERKDFPKTGYIHAAGTMEPTNSFYSMGTRVEAVMVTPRQFAVECMRWSDQTDNASHRELMIRVAKSWMAIAAVLERRLSAGDDLALPDLRSKLD